MANDSKLDASQAKADFDVDSVKLKIQSIYRAAEQNTNEQLKPMDRLRQMLTSIQMSALFEVSEGLFAQVTHPFRSSNNFELTSWIWALLHPILSSFFRLRPHFPTFLACLHKA
jgi:hypothetical protein